MYDARIGRWLSQDPIGLDAGDANLYRYVGNEPTDLLDPSGLQGTEIAAPTLEPQTMRQVADYLVDKFKSEEKANDLLKSRQFIKDGVVFSFSVTVLRDDKVIEKKRASEVLTEDCRDKNDKLTGKKLTFGYFLWAQRINLDKYDETVIQLFKIHTKLTTVAGEVVETDDSQVEGFKLINGTSKSLDLQTIRLSFDPAVVKEVQAVYTATVGAGLYKKKGGKQFEGASDFEVFEARHKGDPTGEIKWLGKTTTYKLVVGFDNKENRTFTGPFDEK